MPIVKSVMPAHQWPVTEISAMKITAKSGENQRRENVTAAKKRRKRLHRALGGGISGGGVTRRLVSCKQ